MPAPTKPGLDWTEIQRGYEGGRTAYQLAQMHPVSRQAIQKRAEKEGWAASKGMPSGARADALPKAFGERNTDNQEIILEALRNGATRSAAAALVGFTLEALKRWCSENSEFALRVEAATADCIVGRTSDIVRASERGDARAAQWLLANHPESRSDFGDKGTKDGPTLNVIINVPRGVEGDTSPTLGCTIDGDAQRVG